MRKHCIAAVKTGPLLLAMALLFTAVGCQPAPPDAAAIAKAQVADEATIRQLDADWVKVAAAKNIDSWTAFYADDAVLLPPNQPIANDKAAIRRSVAGLLTLSGLSLSWQPMKVEVSKSGDQGYLYGAYQLSMNDDKGQPMHDTGKILEIWKKQPDGKWKCIVDTWNSDLIAREKAPRCAGHSRGLDKPVLGEAAWLKQDVVEVRTYSLDSGRS